MNFLIIVIPQFPEFSNTPHILILFQTGAFSDQENSIILISWYFRFITLNTLFFIALYYVTCVFYTFVILGIMDHLKSGLIHKSWIYTLCLQRFFFNILAVSVSFFNQFVINVYIKQNTCFKSWKVTLSWVLYSF